MDANSRSALQSRGGAWTLNWGGQQGKMSTAVSWSWEGANVWELGTKWVEQGCPQLGTRGVDRLTILT